MTCNNMTGITGSLKLDEYGDRQEGNYNFWQLRVNNSKKEWYIKYRYNSLLGVIENIQ